MPLLGPLDIGCLTVFAGAALPQDSPRLLTTPAARLTVGLADLPGIRPMRTKCYSTYRPASRDRQRRPRLQPGQSERCLREGEPSRRPALGWEGLSVVFCRQRVSKPLTDCFPALVPAGLYSICRVCFRHTILNASPLRGAASCRFQWHRWGELFQAHEEHVRNGKGQDSRSSYEGGSQKRPPA
jgi:hypothetical protein